MRQNCHFQAYREGEMRADWIEADKFKPREAGTYLVTTAKGAVILDRFNGDSWASARQE